MAEKRRDTGKSKWSRLEAWEKEVAKTQLVMSAPFPDHVWLALRQKGSSL